MVMSTIIVDDEPLARERLRSLLAEHGDVEITREFATASSVHEFLDRQTPDVIFLDVKLGDSSGLSIANATRSASRPFVVFTTAFSEYAVRAFETRAVDYIMKPIDPTRLSEALDRVRRQMTDRAGPAPTGSATKSGARIAVPNGDRHTLIRPGDIDWLESVGNYVKLHVGDRSFTMRSPLYTFVEQLDPAEFVRIHRRYIVNVSRVMEIARGVKRGDYIVRLAQGTSLPVQRAYVPAMRAAVGRF